MGEVLIKADNVSKKFAMNLKKSLYYGMLDVFNGIARKHQSKELREDEFWAVKNISFEIKRGECLGIIGHNGAGKSTLLKMINGLISPDEGTITMKGKIGALIELGAGFNPILSGRENIYNNAAIIGFTKKEIDEKFEDIVAFSELEEFIDMPVKNYSSGMKVRLGFAIAAQMEPDILILDEVLAVGDLGFRVKCMNRIQELLNNSAVIFVSHAMTQITTICTDVMLMNKGNQEYLGNDIGLGVEKYFIKFETSGEQIISKGNISLLKITLKSKTDKIITDNLVKIKSGDDLEVCFELKVDKDVEELKFRLGIFNIEYKLLAEVDSDQVNFTAKNNHNNTITVAVKISDLHLRYGKYSIHLHVTNALTKERLLRQSDIASFIVEPTISIGADFLLPSKWLQKY